MIGNVFFFQWRTCLQSDKRTDGPDATSCLGNSSTNSMGLVKRDTNPLHVAAYKALDPKGIVVISKACEYR